MPKADTLIRTKLGLPFTRREVVRRPRLLAQVAEGLCRPLTLVTAPAGFGKTTLVASCVAGCGLPVAWLSLDTDDNQADRFLSYVVGALQQVDPTLGREAAQLLAAARPPAPQAILTSLINDLDAVTRDTVLVLDDYQLISSHAVHEQVAFLLEHCPRTLHLVIATRSDPPLPLTRLRARGQTVELRGADLGFTEAEAAQFLNDVMDLHLDARSVAALQERTEGWIAGLQMAGLSLRGHRDVPGFITGFSGTNRYILDYLLDEVLAGQPPEVRRFLLYTSVLGRLTAPLCDAVLAGEEGAKEEGDNRLTGLELRFGGQSASLLEYIERANLFLMSLDDERRWYRYHPLFAGLLRAELQRSAGARAVAQLHVRAADWHAQNGSILEAINHAAAAVDDERVERFIEQNYAELVSRGEQAWMRSWSGKLSRELIYRRPLLCIYEAMSHSWFGELDEADRLLAEAEKGIRSEVSPGDAQFMQANLAYVKSRVAAMRGDIRRAIALCLEARECAPAGNLAMQLDTRITLGYEYFMAGDYANAEPILSEVVRLGTAGGAVINTVAAACILARLAAVQGLLNKSYDTYQLAAQSIPDAGGQHLGARALVEIGIADVLCEWNDLVAARAHIEQGLALLPFWGKADDWALAYLTLARIHLALANGRDAAEAVAKAVQSISTGGVFSEARRAVEAAQVRLWLAQGELPAAARWAASQAKRLSSGEPFSFDNELAHMACARILIAQDRPGEAIGLLPDLERTTRSEGRMGRVIEISLLQTLGLWAIGDSEGAIGLLAECLSLAEPEGYVRIFLDEGRPMRALLARWLAHAGAGPLRTYATYLLSQMDGQQQGMPVARQKATGTGGPAEPAARASRGVLVEPLSQRELEVLQLMALGRTNQEIARQLLVAPGTVKAHAASIYRKLDVTNRTEAVARARQLDVLP